MEHKLLCKLTRQEGISTPMTIHPPETHTQMAQVIQELATKQEGDLALRSFYDGEDAALHHTRKNKAQCLLCLALIRPVSTMRAHVIAVSERTKMKAAPCVKASNALGLEYLSNGLHSPGRFH